MAKKGTKKTAVKAGGTEILSFSDRLSQLRDTQRKQLAEQERRLAADYTRDARRLLDEHISGSKDTTLQSLWGDFKTTSRLASSESGGDGGSSSGGTRQRRTAEEVKADADRLFKIIKDAGSIGSVDLSAKIREAGIVVSGGTVFKFLEAAGHKITTTGERRSTIYSAK